MKKIVTTLLFVCLAWVGSAQSTPYKGLIEVTTKYLEEHEGNLLVGFDVRVRMDAISRKSGIALIPYLEDEGNVMEFPDVLVQGNAQNKVYKRWEKVRRKKGRSYQEPYAVIRVKRSNLDTLVSYTLEVPYEPWMDRAQLKLRQGWVSAHDKRREILINMNKMVYLDIPTPYQVRPQVSFVVPPKETKTRKQEGQAFLDFKLGSTTILPDFSRNPQELAKLRATLDQVVSNPDVLIHGIYLTGYSSPEGHYDNNERLSMGRAMSLRDYIRKEYRLSENLFRVTWGAEDWDGLADLVSQSNMSSKSEVLSIIKNVGIFNGREKQLMDLRGGDPYNYMKSTMFPLLRRVEYRIDYTVKDYDQTKVRSIINKDPELLSQLELFTLAQSYDVESEDFNDIMSLIQKYYGNDPSARINSAAVLINRGELDAAEQKLQGLTDPSAYNNLGVIALMRGDLDRAEVYFKDAVQGGCVVAGANLKEVAAKRVDNKAMARYQDRK